MAVSDEKLMLLEQVTYMDKDVYKKLGLTYPDDRTQILQKIRSLDDKAIERLDGLKVDGTSITGAEWKDIIMAVRSDKELADYECVDYNQDAGAYCFANSKTKEAVVAFRGTLRSNNEWPDNVVGLCTSDTPAQIVAANYVNGLTQYDGISLVGHSKGGNKAQYCTIVAENVNITNCVSMDGEGFSKEFLEKYNSQVLERGGMIKDYSYKGDFVNILLNDVPGSKQIYCDGNATGARNHFPNSMIELVKTGNEWHVIYNEVPQEPGMKYLHDFTCYLANNMSKEDRYETAEFLSEILEHLAGNKKNDSFDIEEFLTTHPESSSKILAYLAAYVKENKLTDKQIESLIRAFGIENEEILGLNMKDFVKLVRYLTENLEGTTIVAEVADRIIDHPHNSLEYLLSGAARIFGIKEKFDKYLPILERTCNYYQKNIKNKKSETPEQQSTDAGAVIGVSDRMRNTVIGTLGVNNITVTPEQLKMQADQLDLLRGSYDSLRDDIVALIKAANKSLSENMQNNMQMKVKTLKDDLTGISDLLESGARAASTAAITYESIDKELAKQISNL